MGLAPMRLGVLRTGAWEGQVSRPVMNSLLSQGCPGDPQEQVDIRIQEL